MGSMSLSSPQRPSGCGPAEWAENPSSWLTLLEKTRCTERSRRSVVAIKEILRILSRVRLSVPIIEKGPTNCQVTSERAGGRASSSLRFGPAAWKSRARGAERRTAPARIVARARWAGLPPRALGVWSYGDAEALPKEPGRSARGGRPGVAALALQGGFRDRHRWRHVDPPVVRAGLADRRQAERPQRRPSAVKLADRDQPDHRRRHRPQPFPASRPRHQGADRATDKVFFQDLTELTSRSEILGAGNGLLAINMPNFWLGNTTPATSSTTPTTPVDLHPRRRRHVPFRRRGHDAQPDQPARQHRDERQLRGHPRPAAARRDADHRRQVDQQHPVGPASGSTTPTTIQHGVDLQRLGPARPVPGQRDPRRRRATPPASSRRTIPARPGSAGRRSSPGPTGRPRSSTRLQNLQGAVTGAIGNVRIGGNATNFSTIVNDATGSGNARITNFSIGGETDNVLLLAPNGSRNISFGLGMDKVDILTNVINNLQANRGALNSRVHVDRTISKVTIGGDVVNTDVETGLQQDFTESSRPSPGRCPRPICSRPWGPRIRPTRSMPRSAAA